MELEEGLAGLRRVGSRIPGARIAGEAVLGGQWQEGGRLVEPLRPGREDGDELDAEAAPELEERRPQPEETFGLPDRKRGKVRQQAVDELVLPVSPERRNAVRPQPTEHRRDLPEPCLKVGRRPRDLRDLPEEPLPRLLVGDLDRRGDAIAGLLEASHLAAGQLADLADGLGDALALIVFLDTLPRHDGGDDPTPDDHRHGEVREAQVTAAVGNLSARQGPVRESGFAAFAFAVGAGEGELHFELAVSQKGPEGALRWRILGTRVDARR